MIDAGAKGFFVLGTLGEKKTRARVLNLSPSPQGPVLGALLQTGRTAPLPASADNVQS